MTNSEQAIREILEKYDEMPYSDISSCLSDLTALISDGYVSKKAYNVIKEHYQSALAAKDINRDYINKYYYPKEFVSWLLNGYTFLKRDQSFVVNYPYLTEHNDYRHFTTDELFNYWEESER